ncbi:MAG: gliding motility-associated C-terminal domain-containing protein [Bacteroidales bacterium]|jgi:gliding motility-associated-like protein|nr:gliding motility-associated C-terminal domain-containing protein [Bacteroidales bacterium]
MKKYFFIFTALFLYSVIITQAQIPTYQMSDQPITGVCEGIFTDSDAGTDLLINPSTYGNNESFIMTFCSGSNEPMTFAFSSLDGPNTSSPVLYDLSNTNPGSLTIYSTGTCLTFWFTSDASGSLFAPNGNWSAYFACGIVTPPVVAADACANAPTICNLDGYFGNTSSSYTADEPGNMCESCGLFEGTLENNSWLQFVANNDTVVFTITLLTCSNNIGIQFGVYSGTNCNNFTLMTPVEWTDVDAPITPGSVSTIVATGLIPGQLYYIMIDGNAGDDCQYIINGLSGIQLGASITPNQTICQGESATIQINVDASIPITWISNPPDPGLAGQENNTTITVSPASSTTYSVHVQNSTGFCSMDTTLVSTVTVLAPNDPACLIPITCTIDKTDATQCPVPPDYTCDGIATVVVSGSSLPFIYSWNDGNTSGTRNNLCAGTYSVTVSDANDLVAPTSCSVTILGPNAPTYSYTTESSCINGSNGSIDLTIVSGSPPYSFHWSNNATTEDISGIPPGNYTVTITDNGSCGAITNIPVGSLPSPPVNFSISPGTGCTPVTAYFEDITNDNIVDWHWEFGDDTEFDGVSQLSHTFTASSQTEVYWASLEVINEDGCSATLLINNAVTVYPNPVATITADPTVAYLNEPITFTGTSGYDVNSWTWDFNYPGGTLETFTVNTASHSYPSEGFYTVFLMIQNNGGCIDTTSIQIEIIDIQIPNIFTPNGDGYNDIFEIKNIERLKNTNIKIFNRWGKKIFDEDNYQNSWDGKNYADGVYYYLITMGGENYFHGTVTIMR